MLHTGMSITLGPVTLASVSLVPTPPTIYLGLSDGATVIISLKADLTTGPATGMTLRETALALNEATLELMRRHREEQAALTTPLPLENVVESAESSGQSSAPSSGPSV